MAGGWTTHTVCALLLLTPLLVFASPVVGEEAGNVAFSTAGLALSPSSPVEGGEVEFTLSLQNLENVIAEDVSVEFHKDSYSQGSPSAAFSLDIAADAFDEVSFTWSNLMYGTQTLWIRVSHGGESELISHDFDVGGLPNLRFANLDILPTSGIHQDDQVQIAIQIENAGHADAGASHLELTFAGAANLLSVVALQSGDSVWMNQTATAPAAGSYEVLGEVNSDSGDGIIESTTADNQETRALFVDVHPDYRHVAGPDVSAALGLSGPWTVSGTVVRDAGTGESTVPMEVRVQNGMTLQMVNLEFSDADEFAEYSVIIHSSNLPSEDPGDTNLQLAIDPSGNVQQSNTFNDLAAATLTIYAEPNVVVGSTAVARPPSTTPGLSVSFDVSLQNVGMVTVTGTLSATFDGVALEPQTVIIPAADMGTQGQVTVSFSAIASGETRQIPFSATWERSVDSFDRLDTDNVATGEVSLISDMRLRFLQTTQTWSPGLPLYADSNYVYSIEVVADQGAGSETFDCIDRKTNKVHDTVLLNFSPGETHEVRCLVHPTDPGTIELAIVPRGTSVDPYAKVWNVEHDGEGGPDTSSFDQTMSIILFILAGLVGIALLAGAVILTRRGLADAERETYEQCPACEGDIEGDEDDCPHCEFDLRGGRSQFHDCDACTKTIPSMMDHCPYCGAEQDLRTHYTARERKYKALPDEEAEPEEEPEVDENEIVRGSEGFDDHAAEMGFEEGQWEGEWEEGIGETEAFFDAKEDARVAGEDTLGEDGEVDDTIESTHLGKVMEDVAEHDLDAFLGGVDDRHHLADEEVELSASDAHYREHLFDITGERGVMPGDEVNVDALIDSTVVGNEVRVSRSDFTVGDEPTPLGLTAPEETTEEAPEEAPEVDSEDASEAEPAPKRRGVRRRKKDE